MLPATSLQRQKLSQRENSKDSAFDGSTVSCITGGDEPDNGPAAERPAHQRSSVVVVKPQSNINHPVTVKLETAASGSPGSVQRIMPDRMASLAANSSVEPGRKSPLLASKANARLIHHQTNKAASHDLHDVIPPPTNNTFKVKLTCAGLTGKKLIFHRRAVFE